jgi:hypothetical protein
MIAAVAPRGLLVLLALVLDLLGGGFFERVLASE